MNWYYDSWDSNFPLWHFDTRTKSFSCDKGPFFPRRNSKNMAVQLQNYDYVFNDIYNMSINHLQLKVISE